MGDSRGQQGEAVTEMRSFRISSRSWMICALLTALTLLSYWQMHQNEFIGFDDAVYVTENPWAQQGLTGKGVIWAFTTTHGGNWHPLTWLSHMLDSHLFGLNSTAHHLGNLLLHIVNTWLLYWVLLRLSGARWPSAMVAALFAIHPLNVESVAWVAERKTLLSAFFGFLAMGAYAAYGKSRTRAAYLATLGLFCLSLMAKPMLVTLPFVFLLLDYWPLRRAATIGGSVSEVDDPCSWRGLLIEKLPFFIPVFLSCMVTLYAQGSEGAIRPLSHLSWKARFSNVAVSYVVYLYKTVWPFGLSVFYPMTGQGRPLIQVFGALLLIAGLLSVAIISAKRKPYLLVGIFWYLGTLVPMIGIVQVGEQAIADRYVYFPLIGIFIIAAWGMQELTQHKALSKRLMTVAAVFIVFFFSLRTWQQISVWRNGESLFQHAIQSTTGNYVAHNNLAVFLAQRGDRQGAVRHLEKAIAVAPQFITARANLAVQLMALNREEAAIEQFKKVVEADRSHGLAHYQLGVYYQRKGRIDTALPHFSQVIQHEPDHADAYFRIGMILDQKGHLNRAREFFSKAGDLDSKYRSDDP